MKLKDCVDLHVNRNLYKKASDYLIVEIDTARRELVNKTKGILLKHSALHNNTQNLKDIQLVMESLNYYRDIILKNNYEVASIDLQKLEDVLENQPFIAYNNQLGLINSVLKLLLEGEDDESD